MIIPYQQTILINKTLCVLQRFVFPLNQIGHIGVNANTGNDGSNDKKWNNKKKNYPARPFKALPAGGSSSLKDLFFLHRTADKFPSIYVKDGFNSVKQLLMIAYRTIP